MGEMRNMLYDASDINWEARQRAEMLSVRPATPDRGLPFRSRNVARNGAIFCLIMVALLVVTWRFM